MYKLLQERLFETKYVLSRPECGIIKLQEDPNTGQVRYSGHGHLSGIKMVQFSGHKDHLNSKMYVVYVEMLREGTLCASLAWVSVLRLRVGIWWQSLGIFSGPQWKLQ